VGKLVIKITPEQALKLLNETGHLTAARFELVCCLLRGIEIETDKEDDNG